MNSYVYTVGNLQDVVARFSGVQLPHDGRTSRLDTLVEAGEIGKFTGL